MSLMKISEKIILNKLKNIENGNLKLVNYDGKVFHFGNFESEISADIKINNPKLYFNIVIGGSSALGEAHMNKEFYTSNLTNLIELTARNINLIHSFSGSFKIQKIKNFLKRIFASNTKAKSLKYISKHYDLGNSFFSEWLDKTLTYSSDLLSRLMLSSNGLYLFIAPVVTLIFLKVSYQIPEFPFNAYNLCIAESIKYAPFFIFGSLLGYNRNLMHDFIKTKAIFTIITALFFIAYIFIPTDKTSTHYIFDLYIHSLIPWILCVLCFKFFNRFFNKESGFFSYLSEASYTIYLFHQFFVIAYGIVLINTELKRYHKR